MSTKMETNSFEHEGSDLEKGSCDFLEIMNLVYEDYGLVPADFESDLEEPDPDDSLPLDELIRRIEALELDCIVEVTDDDDGDTCTDDG